MINELKTVFALILFSLLIYLVGQISSVASLFNHRHLSFENLVYRDGLVYHRFSEKLAHGRVTSGSERGYLKNGKWEGVKTTFSEGIKTSVETFINGEKNGVIKTFNREKLSTEGYLKDGKKHGLFRAWTLNGGLLHKGQYIEGMVSGEHKFWDGYGNLRASISYKDDKIEGSTIFYNLGNNGSYRKTEHKNGVIVDGIYHTYNSDGEITITEEFKNGKRHGLYTDIDISNSKWLIPYIDGVVDGLAQQQNGGKILHSVMYENGVMDGFCRVDAYKTLIGKIEAYWSMGDLILGKGSVPSDASSAYVKEVWKYCSIPYKPIIDPFDPLFPDYSLQ